MRKVPNYPPHIPAHLNPACLKARRLNRGHVMILIPSVLHVVVFLGMLSEIQKIVEGSARYISARADRIMSAMRPKA